MKNSALSVANYFIGLAERNESPIKILRLMKLTYIAHGFMLAILDRSALNPRFDRVEAWKYGPVIPSVYHSFKAYGNNPITKKTVILQEEKENDNYLVNSVTPELEGAEEQKICNLVWKMYSGYDDGKLVELLHKQGSPWALVYEPGQNRPIPDIITKIYYKKLVDSLLEHPTDD